jgi:hypothetical protein
MFFGFLVGSRVMSLLALVFASYVVGGFLVCFSLIELLRVIFAIWVCLREWIFSLLVGLGLGVFVLIHLRPRVI